MKIVITPIKWNNTSHWFMHLYNSFVGNFCTYAAMNTQLSIFPTSHEIKIIFGPMSKNESCHVPHLVMHN